MSELTRLSDLCWYIKLTAVKSEDMVLVLLSSAGRALNAAKGRSGRDLEPHIRALSAVSLSMSSKELSSEGQGAAKCLSRPSRKCSRSASSCSDGMKVSSPENGSPINALSMEDDQYDTSN